ncbi:MAG: TonB-dependent receptor plug domain-containing protein [Campylobacteraceae bacterium]
MKYKNTKNAIRISAFASMLLLSANFVFAQESNQTVNSLDEIHVRASTSNTSNATSNHTVQPGEIYLDSDYVKYAPSATNSITDLLRGKSSIQFDQGSRNSASGGEIAPPKISIHGSNHYENSFLINGVSNNNDLNPSGLASSATSGQMGQPSGEAQSLFLDTSLIDTVSVYTESVSAEYGDFLGGVVDAKLRDARMDRWHVAMSYRYTQDAWAKFHFTPAQESSVAGQTYTDGSFQPEFEKQEYTVSLDGPITDNLGLMVSYGKQKSEIPQWSSYYVFDASGVASKEQRNNYRENENFLVKLNTYDYDDFKASLTAIYAPYTQTMQSAAWKNSDFDIEGGGLTLIYDMENKFSFATLKNTLNYQQTELSRDASTNIFQQYRTDWAPWLDWSSSTNRNSATAYSREGAYGDYEQKKHSIGWKSVLDFDPVYTGQLEHSIKVGLEIEYARAKAKAEGNTVFYYTNTNNYGAQDSSVTGSKDDGILEGSQYSKRKLVYPSESRSEDYTKADLFLEDTMKYDRFTIRPGVRFSYDTITEDINVAPRLFANIDIFNNNILNIYGGYNRYYGSQILAYALAIPYNQYTIYTRNNATDPWTYNSTSTTTTPLRNTLGDLSTPYSDEYHIGASVDIFDTLFRVDYVNRDYKDQIRSKTNADGTSSYTNSGKSKYWGLTFAVDKAYNLGIFGKHTSSFSATRSMKYTDGLDPLAAFEDENGGGTISQTHVTLNGQLARWEDIPGGNYNSPWVFAYTHSVDFNDYFKLFGVFRYQEGGKAVVRYTAANAGYPALTDPNGITTAIYEVGYYKNTFNIDLAAETDIKIKGNKFIFGIEVFNLMNRKNDSRAVTGSYSTATATTSGSYSMGRQIYANFRYEF